MHCSQENHFHETDYLRKVNNYLISAYGTSIDELALSHSEISKGLHNNLHASEYVDSHAREWGIHRRKSSIPGTAPRIVHV
jgi:hypothetical protein